MRKTAIFVLLVSWIVMVLAGLNWYLNRIEAGNKDYLTTTTDLLIARKLNSVDADTQIQANPLLKFCNLPLETKIVGQEGNIDNHTLIGTIVIFRHGDRGPLTPALSKRPVNCSSFISKRFTKLEKFIQNSKPADRSNYLSVLPQSDHCKAGLLTKQGSSQLIELGYFLQKSYIALYNFTSDDIINDIYAYSTPYSRTTQSLRSLLYGLLGFKLFSNVTIDISGTVPFCFKYCRCRAADHFEKQHKKEMVYRVGQMTALNSISTQQMKSALQNSWKLNKDALPSTIKDVLLTYACHNETPPCHDKGVCLTLEMMHLLDHLLNHEANVSSSGVHLKKAAILRAYGLLNDIDQHIQQWISRHKKMHSAVKRPQFLFYSGHDLTLMYLLSSLSLYDGYLPYYASRFIIEVFTDQVHYYARLLWNGIDVTGKVTVCAGMPYCNARFLPKLIRQVMKTLFQTNKFSEACQL